MIHNLLNEPSWWKRFAVRVRGPAHNLFCTLHHLSVKSLEIDEEQTICQATVQKAQQQNTMILQIYEVNELKAILRRIDLIRWRVCTISQDFELRVTHILVHTLLNGGGSRNFRKWLWTLPPDRVQKFPRVPYGWSWTHSQCCQVSRCLPLLSCRTRVGLRHLEEHWPTTRARRSSHKLHWMTWLLLVHTHGVCVWFVGLYRTWCVKVDFCMETEPHRCPNFKCLVVRPTSLVLRCTFMEQESVLILPNVPVISAGPMS